MSNERFRETLKWKDYIPDMIFEAGMVIIDADDDILVVGDVTPEGNCLQGRGCGCCSPYWGTGDSTVETKVLKWAWLHEAIK